MLIKSHVARKLRQADITYSKPPFVFSVYLLLSPLTVYLCGMVVRGALVLK